MASRRDHHSPRSRSDSGISISLSSVSQMSRRHMLPRVRPQARWLTRVARAATSHRDRRSALAVPLRDASLSALLRGGRARRRSGPTPWSSAKCEGAAAAARRAGSACLTILCRSLPLLAISVIPLQSVPCFLPLLPLREPPLRKATVVKPPGHNFALDTELLHERIPLLTGRIRVERKERFELGSLLLRNRRAPVHRLGLVLSRLSLRNLRALGLARAAFLSGFSCLGLAAVAPCSSGSSPGARRAPDPPSRSLERRPHRRRHRLSRHSAARPLARPHGAET